MEDTRSNQLAVADEYLLMSDTPATGQQKQSFDQACLLALLECLIQEAKHAPVPFFCCRIVFYIVRLGSLGSHAFITLQSTVNSFECSPEQLWLLLLGADCVLYL